MATARSLCREEGGPLDGVDENTPAKLIAEKYDDWACRYDQNMVAYKYRAPEISVKVFLDMIHGNGLGIRISKTSSIGDIGAGTGIIGELLTKEGFTNLHAVDISPQMLKIAQEKGYYKTVICGGIGNNTLSIKNEYDAVFCIGCITIGHIKPPGVDELVDMAKPGGLVLFTIRSDAAVLKEMGYVDRLEKLVSEKKVRMIYKEKVDYLSYAEESDPAKHCVLFGYVKL